MLRDTTIQVAVPACIFGSRLIIDITRGTIDTLPEAPIYADYACLIVAVCDGSECRP
jgi:hypothetical protein